MNPQLTDDAVAALPLHAGRAELLEEIMQTPVLDDRPVDTLTAGRRRRWLAPVAAAAAVGALAAGSAWWTASSGPDAPPPVTNAGPEDPRGSAGTYRAVLDDEGWTVQDVYDDAKEGTGDVGYSQGGRSLEIDWYPADDYDSRYEDRRHITDPPSDGTAVEVLGLPATMWAYSADDHTVIRPVENGHYLEIRGSGMTEQEYLDLLGRLRLVDADGFQAALPDSYVTDSERAPRVQAMLDGIAEHADPLLPPGTERSSITSDQSDPYHVGADVTGQVACAWVGEYARARQAGDDAAAQQAVDVMATSRQWPVLLQMDDRGDWSEWVWSMADEMADGQVPPGWRQSCAD